MSSFKIELTIFKLRGMASASAHITSIWSLTWNSQNHATLQGNCPQFFLSSQLPQHGTPTPHPRVQFAVSASAKRLRMTQKSPAVTGTSNVSSVISAKNISAMDPTSSTDATCFTSHVTVTFSLRDVSFAPEFSLNSLWSAHLAICTMPRASHVPVVTSQSHPRRHSTV